MGIARHATPDDVGELVRLRAIMLAEWLDPADNGWMADTAAVLEQHLAEPESSMTAVVADAPGTPGSLAACAVGTIHQRLPSPRNRTGRVGWVLNVVTDPPWRGRGLAKACMAELMAWFDARSVLAVELHATEAGMPLYERLGFTRTGEPPMRYAPWA